MNFILCKPEIVSLTYHDSPGGLSVRRFCFKACYNLELAKREWIWQSLRILFFWNRHSQLLF